MAGERRLVEDRLAIGGYSVEHVEDSNIPVTMTPTERKNRAEYLSYVQECEKAGIKPASYYSMYEAPDLVNHPPHYKANPSGVECIDVVEHLNFNMGNAIKYIWRADEKGDPIENLRKAEWYVKREIERRTNGTES